MRAGRREHRPSGGRHLGRRTRPRARMVCDQGKVESEGKERKGGRGYRYRWTDRIESMDRGVLRAEGLAAAFLVLATWSADWRGTWAELTVLDDMRRELEKKRRAGLSMVGSRRSSELIGTRRGRVRESKKWSSGKKRQSSSLRSSTKSHTAFRACTCSTLRRLQREPRLRERKKRDLHEENGQEQGRGSVRVNKAFAHRAGSREDQLWTKWTRKYERREKREKHVQGWGMYRKKGVC